MELLIDLISLSMIVKLSKRFALEVWWTFQSLLLLGLLRVKWLEN